jgi:hypothetical protein
MALTGVMSFWPEVVKANSNEAAYLLHEAAKLVLQPTCLLILASAACMVLWLAKQFWTRAARPSEHQEAWSVAAAVLSTTLFIDALFLMLSLSVPSLSGLI